MATNLSSVLNTIGGVGRLWIYNYGKAWNGAKKIEDLVIPFTTSGNIGANVDFDLVGKLDMDSVDTNGDDMNIVDHKFTDGSVGVKLVEDGTYGFSCQSMNVAELICENILNMKKEAVASAAAVKNLGDDYLAYGIDGNIGFINPCAIFLETLTSDKYSGILYPYASLSASLKIAGNKTDIWTININAGAQNCPLKALTMTGTTADLTAKWGEASYILIGKKREAGN